MNTLPIREFKDPEIFLALKKMCRYVVNVAWNVSVGSDEVDAEYNLAVAKTKRHKDDVEKIANLDTDLVWGAVKKRTGKNSFVTTLEGDFNPWYDGDLTLRQLLDSMEALAEFLELSGPRHIEEAEYLHFYKYLQYVLIPAESLKKAPVRSITFDSLHPKIQEHCSRRYKSQNYSDAIFAAYTVVFTELKVLTGIRNLDGKKLAEKVFALDSPVIKLNDLQSESEQNEQKGFMLLLGGAYLGIRDPKAHDLIEQADEYRTLEYLSFASLLLERIDERKSVDLDAISRAPKQKFDKLHNQNTPEPPYVYIEGSFGGNGQAMSFRACTTYNLSDHFIFIEKIDVLDATISFAGHPPIKSGEKVTHTGVDGLSYPTENDLKKTIKIYFHTRNKEHFVSTHKLKFQKRADERYNIVGIEEPVIARVKKDTET